MTSPQLSNGHRECSDGTKNRTIKGLSRKQVPKSVLKNGGERSISQRETRRISSGVNL